MNEEEEKKADILRIPSWDVHCPHCDEPVIQETAMTLKRFRDLYEGYHCDKCGKSIHLGKVVY